MLATLAAIFTLLFLVEASMKSCALGFVGYWQSRRNRLDLIITILGLVWIILHFTSFSKKETLKHEARRVRRATGAKKESTPPVQMKVEEIA